MLPRLTSILAIALATLLVFAVLQQRVSTGNAIVLAKSNPSPMTKLDAQTTPRVRLDPGSQEYAWWQLDNFLARQGVGTGAQITIDPDWRGPWADKVDLNLTASPTDCQGFDDPSAHIHTPIQTFDKIESAVIEFPPELRSTHNASPAVPPGTSAASDANIPCSGVIQTVLYNQTAADYISGKTTHRNLEDGKPFPDMLKNHQSIRFDSGSVIVKALWEAVWPNSQADGETLGVWDPANPTIAPVVQNFPAVQIVSGRPDAACSTADYPPGRSPRTQVPNSCFIEAKFGGRVFALVGLNIAHKVDNVWYWYTYAWSSSVSNSNLTRSGFASPSSRSPWAHYVMATTHDPSGATTCFNPYLEGPNKNGSDSNCIRCHQFATYGKPTASGQDVTTGKSKLPVLSRAVQNYLNGTLPTDSVWSLITHLGPHS